LVQVYNVESWNGFYEGFGSGHFVAPDKDRFGLVQLRFICAPF